MSASHNLGIPKGRVKSRFIPVGTGNTWSILSAICRSAVNPRMRGVVVNPRMRGEHLMPHAWVSFSAGSSPHARGTRNQSTLS